MGIWIPIIIRKITDILSQAIVWMYEPKVIVATGTKLAIIGFAGKNTFQYTKKNTKTLQVNRAFYIYLLITDTYKEILKLGNGASGMANG